MTNLSILHLVKNKAKKHNGPLSWTTFCDRLYNGGVKHIAGACCLQLVGLDQQHIPHRLVSGTLHGAHAMCSVHSWSSHWQYTQVLGLSVHADPAWDICCHSHSLWASCGMLDQPPVLPAVPGPVHMSQAVCTLCQPLRLVQVAYRLQA